MKYEELSANTVALISCSRRLTKVSAGAARGIKGSKSGGGRVRLPNVDTGIEVEVEMVYQLVLQS